MNIPKAKRCGETNSFCKDSDRLKIYEDINNFIWWSPDGTRSRQAGPLLNFNKFSCDQPSASPVPLDHKNKTSGTYCRLQFQQSMIQCMHLTSIFFLKSRFLSRVTPKCLISSYSIKLLRNVEFFCRHPNGIKIEFVNRTCFHVKNVPNTTSLKSKAPSIRVTTW